MPCLRPRLRPAALMAAALTVLALAPGLAAQEPAPADMLPALAGPMAGAELIGLPVRTYGGAPPVAVVDDLLLKADGAVSKMVLDDGTFLKMGLDGKRVALPFDAAVAVPGPEGGPAYLRINIAKAYGQVIKEFLYDLIAPTDYALKAILGAPVAAADLPAAAEVAEVWISRDGRALLVDLEMNPGASSVSWQVQMPFSALTLTRPGPAEETRLSTALTAGALRALPAAGGRPEPGTMTEPGAMTGPASEAPNRPDPLEPTRPFAPSVPPMQ